MMENNGLTPAEFLRPFGEVGNLGNYAVKTCEKNAAYKLDERFRINFIDSHKMWTDAKESDRITQKIVTDRSPRVGGNPAENMPTTKKEINNSLLELLERDR